MDRDSLSKIPAYNKVAHSKTLMEAVREEQRRVMPSLLAELMAAQRKATPKLLADSLSKGSAASSNNRNKGSAGSLSKAVRQALKLTSSGDKVQVDPLLMRQGRYPQE